MRLPLDDITNTVTVTSSSSDTSNNPSKHLLASSSPPVPTISLPSLPLKASSRPKLLRQTSLLAFAARSPAPASTPACSSPTASTSSSPPPPPSSSPSTSIPTHPRSDEGYSSTRDCFVDLACAPSSSSARTTRDEEEDDAQSDTEEQEHYHNNKRLRIQYTQQHDDEPSSLARDPAALARQAKAMARNRANLFGETSRVSGFSDIARLAEYGRAQASSSTLSRLTDQHSVNYLESYVSHYKRDIFRCPSYRPYRDFAPPFACSFSKESKRGGKKTLAISTEEGTVCYLDADFQPGVDCGDATYFQAHNNAVFDLVWSADDRQIATASGDQTAAVSDVEKKIRTHTLKTHCCSVKQVIFDPHNPNLLATASRDGSIGLWDLRNKPNKDGNLSTVNHIRFAHDTYAKTRKGKETARSVTRSVTSIVYLQHQDNLLASGGSADGVVKLWDLRKTFSKRINPPSIEESLDYTPVSSFDIQGPPSSSSTTFSSNSLPHASLFSSSSSSSTGTPSSSSFAPTRTTRTHGISSLCLAPDGSRLYALSTNSKIYAHDPLFLSRPLPAPMHTFSSPTMCSSSFYIRLSISPDGRYLAAGSSSLGWQTSIWDLQARNAKNVYGETKNATVALKGHGHEVGGIDWADECLATCGDDDLVRTWRPDWHTLLACRDDTGGYARGYHAGIWDLVDR